MRSLEGLDVYTAAYKVKTNIKLYYKVCLVFVKKSEFKPRIREASFSKLKIFSYAMLIFTVEVGQHRWPSRFCCSHTETLAACMDLICASGFHPVKARQEYIYCTYFGHSSSGSPLLLLPLTFPSTAPV